MLKIWLPILKLESGREEQVFREVVEVENFMSIHYTQEILNSISRS